MRSHATPAPAFDATLDGTPCASPREPQNAPRALRLVPEAPAAAPPAAEAFDGYRLIELLGRGGMGEVWRAHDGLLDRWVAIKFLTNAEADADARRRFLVEGRAIARLQHPSVVQVYRVGERAGRPYLVSEYVPGRALDQLPLPLPPHEVFRIALEVARGLSVAHHRGVLHRDVKPANVILADDGAVKILDFGIAKFVAAAEREATPAPAPIAHLPCDPNGATLAPHAITRPGALLGTPAYLAPELWRGAAATFRTDVYALGALLYTLCAGRPPYVADTLGALRDEVLGGRHAPLPADVGPALAAIIERCLAFEPEDRFATANDVRAALMRLTPQGRDEGGAAGGNPYRGLHAFDREHRDVFFGRDSETRMVLDRLRAEPFVLVAGDSGTGKSSLCRAGVLPRADVALGGGRQWSGVTLVPGRHPITALSAALAPLIGGDERALAAAMVEDACDFARRLRAALGDGRGLILFVDQFEELVTLAAPDERTAAVDVLAWLVSPSPSVRVLGSVRGDFLSRIAALPRIGELASRALYFLRPLNEDRVGEVIVGPAQARGVAYESPALVERLVRETIGGGGGLPLLQFALHELWNALPRGTRVIGREVIEAVGGVTGALTRHADRVLAQMLPEERRAARPLLLRLVTAEGARGALALEELGETTALDALVRGRLVVARDTAEGPRYEIAHEALIRGWETLARWLSEDAGARLVRDRLRRAVAEWERLGRAREALWSPRQLQEAQGIEPADARERAFLEASRRAARRARRLRLAAWILPPLIVLATYAGTRVRQGLELRARVDAEVEAARLALTEARARRDAADELRRRALALFDAPDLEAAEPAWAKARAAADAIAPVYALGGRHLEAALQLDPRRTDVRALFADEIYERALLAEAQGDRRTLAEALPRLDVYDTGGVRRARWAAPGRLTLTLDPPDAKAQLFRYVASDDGPPAEVPAALSATLPTGAYRVEASAPGRATVRETFVVRRDAEVRLTLRLPPAEAVPPGYVYVPPGRFAFGSAADDGLRRDYFHTVPLHEVETGGYLIADHETTFAEWIEFLEALPEAERAALTPRVGKGGFTGALGLERLPDGRWRLTIQPADTPYTVVEGEPLVYAGRTRHAAHDWRRLPVVGIAVADAQRFTAWLSASGRVPGARLCTDHEWERAARGADGREYPHGATRLAPDDANVDATYGKSPATMGPDAVGTHPASRSPYGVHDLSGNVWEWTRSSLRTDEFPARGGSYNFGPNTARVTGREITESSFRDVSVGMRVCASFDR